MHDYDISWDYTRDFKVKREYLLVLKKVCKEIKRRKLFSFKSFSVYPIILDDENTLGVYCYGTAEKPVIGIDIENHLKGCEAYNVNFTKALKTTILHELKHAWQEYNDLDFNEQEAEDFAFYNS